MKAFGWTAFLAALVAGPALAKAPARSVRPARTAHSAPTSASVPAPAWLAPSQYLLGSGEAAALSRASWAALVDYVSRALAAPQRQSVVFAPSSTLEAPRFVPCDRKPPAVVLDIDESAVLNVGWQYDDAAAGGRPFDMARWRRWEADGADRAVPTPGAIEAIARLRALGVEIVFNSNRDAAFATETARMIAGAGLGEAVPGRTLFLREDGASPAKDARRAAIAADRCVLAMLGDQLGDFSDLFDRGQPPPARRAAIAVPAIADLWGEGWFVMPNPLYGTAIRGGMDDIFPAGLRWTDPGAAPSAPGPSPLDSLNKEPR